jgi:hypothetical protein
MVRDLKPKQVIVYADPKGKEPFTEWHYCAMPGGANAFSPGSHG